MAALLRAGWRLLAAVALMLPLPGVAAADGAMDRYFVSSDGVRLHYLEAGEGERTIVFVPGWLMPAQIFELQLAALSREFRVLAFDPRSQGRSDVSVGDHGPAIRTRDLSQLLAAAKVDTFVLAGWSLGVLETLDYVARFRPAGLKGMILIDNSIGEGTPPRPRRPGSHDPLAVEPQRTRYLTEFCTSMFHQPPPESIRDAVLASALRVPPRAARQTIGQPYPRTYWRDIVEGLDVPVLYVVTPRLREQASVLERKKGIGGAEVEIFATAGHALFVDEAERFNAIAARFAGAAFRAP